MTIDEILGIVDSLPHVIDGPLEQLAAEVQRLRGIIHEVAACAVSMSDPRIKYIEIQMDRSFWESLRAADVAAKVGE